MRYSLRTFGGLTLLDNETGEAVTEKRRKALAILAILAVAGDLAVSRDKLAAYLWNDGGPDRVRGVLKQTIYIFKRELADADLLLGQSDLRLNHALIDSDVALLEQAAREHDSAQVVDLYRGPFLDGFHLPEAPLFEHWVDTQRDRLARVFAAHIERLALAAMARGNPQAAIDWWARLVEFDPYDTRAVSGLLHACLTAGDRPRAIRLAERHMGLLRKELEITPDPEIRRLVELAKARPVAGTGN